MEDNLTTQLSIEEKANLENLEGAIKRELGSFIVVGMALEEIRAKGLYRDGYKTFRDYCNQKWDMNGRYADRLIAGSQVAENLGPRDPTMTPCEIQPMFEKQVRPLAVLAPSEQRDVWGEAVRTYAIDHPGKAPTYSHVKAVVKEYLGPAAPVPAPPGKRILTPFSDALNLVGGAIATLSRIRDDDPQKNEAVKFLMKWIKETYPLD